MIGNPNNSRREAVRIAQANGVGKRAAIEAAARARDLRNIGRLLDASRRSHPDTTR